MQPSPIPSETRNYARKNSNLESEILQELKRETIEKSDKSRMLSGTLNGKFFRLICQLLNATHVLEIGTYTGYSALCMAEGMADNGSIITCDFDEETTKIARKYWKMSPHGSKIKLILGNGAKTIESLKGPFDFVFIDADKQSYPIYWDLVVPKVRSGGIIAIDNVFLNGGVMNPKSEIDESMREFNIMVRDDPRVDVIMLTLRDGITLAQKL